jgi:predicted enzyme related to lactoylglutathione lyase
LSYWAVYFVVEDPDATLDLAVANGAKVVYPLMDVPDVGRFGYLADPQGALFAVIRMEGEAG